MDKALDFSDKLFGNIAEYNKLITSLLESLKNVTLDTFWEMGSPQQKGLSTIVTMDIINTILDSYDVISERLYGNKLVLHEYPIFIETREMVECLLLDPIYENDDYLNLAIALSTDFFTILEVKLLLFEGYEHELLAPKHVINEYDKELDKYLERFDEYRNKFIEIHD
ncbi:MAG: hypothetical protein LUG89_04935 [Methanosphaera sp.]|nr:hypothetical protein [Methanosphaera sp.]